MANDAQSIVVDLSIASNTFTVPTGLQAASNISNGAETDFENSRWGSEYEGIDWQGILGYHVPNPPSKRSAWFWKYGYDIQDARDHSKHWLCKTCHQKMWYRRHRFAESGTDNIKRHMREQHALDENGEPISKKRKQDFFQRANLDATEPREQEILLGVGHVDVTWYHAH